MPCTNEFRICSMLWMKDGQFYQTICDLAHNQLPPPRTYKPTKEQIEEWWPTCQQWIEEHYAVHRGITLTKLNLEGLAEPSYGRL